MQRRWLLAIPVLLAVVLLLLWLARATIAVQFAQSYFKSHGVPSSVEIGSLGLSGVSARFSLGPRDAPELSAQRIELHFDPLRWMPYVVEVRLVNPVVRAAVDANGKVRLGSLQAWLDSLGRQQGKSRFISDDLTVSLTGLRLLLATPGGAVEVGGDVRLVKNLPVLLALRAKPARIVYRDMIVAMRSASLSFDQKAARLGLQFSGAAANSSFDIQGLELGADASGLTWRAVDRRFSVAAPSVHLRAAANAAVAGQRVHTPKLDAEIRNFSAASSSNGMDASADIAVTSQASFDAPALASLQAADPVLAHAIRQNIGRLSVAFAGHAERRGDIVRFDLTRNLQIRGAKGASLDVPALSLSGSRNGLTASLNASLAGRGLPAAKMSLGNLFWSGGGFTSDVTLSARFNFAMLRGTVFSGRGKFSWQNGQYAFTPLGCMRATLAAFHPGASDLAKNVRGEICAPPQQPLLTGEGIGWTLSGQARNASADLPLATVRAENVVAGLNFDGEGAPLKGTATVTAGRVLDRAANLRFKPLLGTGTASLAKGVWT
ncbi:MAG TPA: hypothetical protein VJM78_02590, partial [Rhizomicrobium sp.]|nr:hypothetical protein [Rhizomicrobium sp.]